MKIFIVEDSKLVIERLTRLFSESPGQEVVGTAGGAHKALKGIDIAFLPMNLPYTMTPQMAADAALAFRPHVLYPYHYGETDPGILAGLLKDAKDIEVRIRSMK